MDARAQLYNDIKGIIASRVEEIKHVGLWNQDADFLEEGTPYELPALFIEFGNIEWGSYAKDGEKGMFAVGRGNVKYHLLCEWNNETDDTTPFILSEKINRVLVSIPSSTLYSVWYPSVTYTNHDHANIVESGEEFMVKYWRIIPKEDRGNDNHIRYKFV